MATPKEIETIKEYMRKNLSKEYLSSLKSQNREPLECQFRDILMKRCAIYPVRPVICRLMGVVKGMTCENGNTVEIDGTPFISPDAKIVPKLY
jgi:Fe-S-cluster containining protein